jgi:hypothetical protein
MKKLKNYKRIIHIDIINIGETRIIFVVLGIKLKKLNVLGKCCTTGMHPQPSDTRILTEGQYFYNLCC